jgi:hypothetical protein
MTDGVTLLERFQKMCSRRRQSAQIELRKTAWRELTFAATELIELLLDVGLVCSQGSRDAAGRQDACRYRSVVSGYTPGMRGKRF